MHINIDKRKAEKKWTPILESLGIQDPTKKEWMSEYAEYHAINENVAYSTLGNLSGMGGVVSPIPSGIPGDAGAGSFTPVAGAPFGQGGAAGSGDYGQQLLPVAMKVAAQTIGLDLVAVKPSPGPVIDLMYIDYRYDDKNDSDEYNPVVFKVDGDNVDVMTAQLDSIVFGAGANYTQGGINKQIFVSLGDGAALTQGRLPVGPTNPATPFPAAGRTGQIIIDATVVPDNKESILEFLGYSRIDKMPMFRAFRQTNAAATGANWIWVQNKNTFAQMETVAEAFNDSAADSDGSTQGSNFIGQLGNAKVELVSSLEDHLPGFSSGFNRKGAMSREQDEANYPGVIGPNVATKRIQVGTVEVSSALKRTEIEDIKSQTGIDIVAKLESVLINELSQTISKEIVYKIFEMGEENRKSAPVNALAAAPNNTVFDFDVDDYFNGGGGIAPGGETTNSAQRKLLTRIDAASNFIATEGRIGPAQYLVTNAKLAAVLKTAAGYTINPIKSSLNPNGQLYPQGVIGDITIYVDPYQLYNDDRIVVGRKNNPDQPGLIFVPYLMAQSISLISEATFAPRMLLRSRYAITDVGFFPQKQFMTMKVKDTFGYLT